MSNICYRGPWLNKVAELIHEFKLILLQEKLVEENWSSIKAELMNPHEITEVLSLVEIVINFASFGKERPQRPIKSYMQEVLKYPNSKGLVNNKVTC